MKSATYEEFEAFNDELAALVKAGVPLGSGLRDVAQEKSGKFKEVSLRIANSLDQGESIDKAIESESGFFPKIYRTIIKTGVKSGKLTESLESLAEYARSLIQLRKSIGLTLIYPIILLCFAYLFFTVLILEMVMRMRSTLLQFRTESEIPQLLSFFKTLHSSLNSWFWIPPIILVLLVFWWIVSRGNRIIDASGLAGPLRWIPGMKAIAWNYQLSIFSKHLSILTNNAVPLGEAVELSQEIVNNPRITKAAKQLTEEGLIGAGESNNKTRKSAPKTKFPSYLEWILLEGQRTNRLPHTLQSASDFYKNISIQRADRLRLLLPIFGVFVIGGLLLLFYCISLYLPFIQVLDILSQPTRTL